MAFNDNYTNGYWPFEEDEIIQHFEHIMDINRSLILQDGNSHFFTVVERYTNAAHNLDVMIYYICEERPHTHVLQPSCSRIIMCYRPQPRNQG